MVSHSFSSVSSQWNRRLTCWSWFFPYPISKTKLLATPLIERLSSPNKAWERSVWRSFSYVWYTSLYGRLAAYIPLGWHHQLCGLSPCLFLDPDYNRTQDITYFSSSVWNGLSLEKWPWKIILEWPICLKRMGRHSKVLSEQRRQTEQFLSSSPSLFHQIKVRQVPLSGLIIPRTSLACSPQWWNTKNWIYIQTLLDWVEYPIPREAAFPPDHLCAITGRMDNKTCGVLGCARSNGLHVTWYNGWDWRNSTKLKKEKHMKQLSTSGKNMYNKEEGGLWGMECGAGCG